MHWSWVIIAALTLYYYYWYSTTAKSRRKGKATRPVSEPEVAATRDTPPQAPQAPQHQPERVIGPEDFEDPGFDPELEQLNYNNNNNAGAGPGAAGPSRSSEGGAVVGTKKARSLERKDQRRAYFEHLRMQAQYDREEQEEYERQYADLRAEEQAAQAAANRAAIAEREADLVDARNREREAAEAARSVEAALVADAAADPRGVRRLETETERAAAARVVERGSSTSDNARQFLAGEDGDWLVRVSSGDVDRLAQEVQARGKVSFSELAQYLTELKRG
ncbi:hypothetical protein DV454_001829 [Geotrichum candidum]|nr:hypothetical protein DV454_001829 [Geotrichum candidum]